MVGGPIFQLHQSKRLCGAGYQAFKTSIWPMRPGSITPPRIRQSFLAQKPGVSLTLFIKPRTADTRHDWKDVRVIGEHRVSNNEWRAKFLQVGMYVRDVFSVQLTRRFVHAFTFLGTMMELWVFDRSGPYSSGSFDIHSEPEKFIRAR